MRRMKLSDFAAEIGQTKAAEMLGLTQGALNKALRVGREIFVTEHDDGSISAEELRPFPSQQKTQAA
ncbi:Cro/CI family transcriptional regulator [Pseudomonas sp. USHLN015]|uniref:Cro/CI family transcriptional regulator n=1 Tax=Pseudomonas sp. USHLN015 TaxID=3081296 RepID=UPI00301D473E